MLLVCRRDSTKTAETGIHVPGPQYVSHGVNNVEQSHPCPPLIFIAPYEMAELRDVNVQKSTVEGLAHLSHSLHSIALGLGTIPLAPVLLSRTRVLHTLLDQLVNAQQCLRSSLCHVVLEW